MPNCDWSSSSLALISSVLSTNVATSVAKKPTRKRAKKVTKEIIEEVKDFKDRSDFQKGKDEDPLVKLAKKSRKSRNRKAKK